MFLPELGPKKKKQFQAPLTELNLKVSPLKLFQVLPSHPFYFLLFSHASVFTCLIYFGSTSDVVSQIYAKIILEKFCVAYESDQKLQLKL